MKVTSKDLYAILRESLAPTMKEAGFKRAKGGMLGWVRSERDQYLCLWFQCDKYGWFDDFGSSFTLEFQLDDDQIMGSGGFRSRARYVDFLNTEEMELIRSINNGVLSQLPTPKPSNPVMALGDDGVKMFMSAFQVSPEPYGQKQDVWLHYFTRKDVEVWAAFFKERLIPMSSAFLSSLSEAQPGAPGDGPRPAGSARA